MKKGLPSKYCNDIFNYARIESREVLIGTLKLGGNSPIRIQSMTDTNTMDTLATVEQSKRIFDAGADLVRITAPAIRDAKNLSLIRAELHRQGYSGPLVADIHYSPNAAEMAAQYVEKVRINPGNYIDKNASNRGDFNDVEYSAELDKIYHNLRPLIQQCKNTATAIRIGTNHGSLSNRILARYGDTPKGMVESTLEFLRIFARENFHDIVLSLKSSNVGVMVHANRLLVKQMQEEGFNYPIHLGVTEAGEGEDGRIKSAVGIATLLVDGIGDTIRVSLTEAPEKEIPIARKIVDYINLRKGIQLSETPSISGFNPFECNRSATLQVANIGGNKVPVVISNFSLSKLGGEETEQIITSLNMGDQRPDYYYFGGRAFSLAPSLNVGFLFDFENWKANYPGTKNCFPVLSATEFQQEKNIQANIIFLRINYSDLNRNLIEQIKADDKVVVLAGSESRNWIGEQRAIVFTLINSECQAPMIPFHSYNDSDIEDFQLKASCDFGPLCIDGFVDGILLQSSAAISHQPSIATAFGILQASRLRISKTEYISCPGCGRTLFALQETTRKIRERTTHLKGLKIGVMGCIVNGPGEMADADFGYVGAGPGQISLYRNKELIRKNIPESEAVEALVQLIKENGKWVEP
ncbi:MAG: (E)-4-hydroxy-3-methylbut-2-enyl-diphosphate synthase [Bacteroidales bacterium]|nr:(E)-4-hydroxy-3-methylbut-2-enyl-diphosphate synthase [Bacteroidales bacterium]MCF8455326.1 (E)-4-hydroxy-3-methylbut-2-enyl-diphosphate synthase [Bacteroidales bacterium]